MPRVALPEFSRTAFEPATFGSIYIQYKKNKAGNYRLTFATMTNIINECLPQGIRTASPVLSRSSSAALFCDRPLVQRS